MIKNIYICLLFFLLISCSGSKGEIYFITDNYMPEIMNGSHIMEEFNKITVKNKLYFSSFTVSSEKELNSVLEGINITDNDKIIMTAFVYNNFISEKTVFKYPLYMIGPWFDMDRNKTVLTGNMNDSITDAVIGIGQENNFRSAVFYTDDDSISFPEKEIINSISSGINQVSENPVSFVNKKINKIGQVQDSSTLSVIIPEGELDKLLNTLKGVKTPYILFDFGNISSLDLFFSAPEPFFVMKYDYLKSFEAVLLFNNEKSGQKNVYSCCFEKK